MASVGKLTPPLVEDPAKEADDSDFRQAFNDLIGAEEAVEQASTDLGLGLDRHEIQKKALSYSKYIIPVGTKLRDKFTTVKSNRQEYEAGWMRDLRQYRGEYDPEVAQAIHPKRSKAFARITYNKVKTMDSRLDDLLFPNSADKNWDIKPTPVPELNPEEKAKVVQTVTEQMQREVSDVEIEEILGKVAKLRAEAMRKEIADQLAELRYHDIIRSVVHSGNLYGTGILKGPLIKEKTVSRYIQKPDKTWATVTSDVTMPYAEFVPIWDVYPDITATRAEDLRFIFQRHVMGKNELYELTTRKDFNKDALLAFLEAHPVGTASYENFETEFQTLSDATVMPADREGRYEVLEYWGFCDVEDITEYPQFKLPDDYNYSEIAVNVWLLDNVIIKAAFSPLENAKFPYYFYYFSKDETSIFGEGIASITRHPQMLANAAVRVMVDNAAISAGPIIEANLDLLPENEDPTDIYPFRTILRTGAGQEASYQAIRVTQLESHTAEFMNMFELFQKMADDVSAIPRYMYGETGGSSGGAARTASGLSMLMGAANITLKEQVKNFDEGITKPFIGAIYDWNMEFNPKQEIKGDYNIVPMGTSSLIAKEVRIEALIKFIQFTASPLYSQFIKPQNIVREVAAVLDLDGEPFVKTDQELAIEREQAAKAAAFQAEQQLNMQREEAMLAAQAGGHAGKTEGASSGPQDPVTEFFGQQSVGGMAGGG